MQDVFSDDILQKFNMAQNKVSYTYSDGYSKWNYVRCGYSYDLQKYYINDELYKEEKHNFFYQHNIF